MVRSDGQHPSPGPGLPVRGDGAIPLRDVEFRTSRSSGPGGQHANVTASRVEATVDLTTCGGIDDDVRRRLIQRLGPRVSAVAQDTRSQARNRELALERLKQRIAQALVVRAKRRPTRPTKASAQRRLEAKRRQAERKRARRPPPADGQ